MKILFAHTPPDLYGASKSLMRLTSRLVKDGNEIHVILNDKGELGEELIKNGIKVIIHKKLIYIGRDKLKKPFSFLLLLLNLPSSVYQLMKIIKRISPDIIHTNTALIISPAIAAYISRKSHIWHIRETFTEFGSLWKVYRGILSFLSSYKLSINCRTR